MYNGFIYPWLPSSSTFGAEDGMQDFGLLFYVREGIRKSYLAGSEFDFAEEENQNTACTVPSSNFLRGKGWNFIVGATH